MKLLIVLISTILSLVYSEENGFENIMYEQPKLEKLDFDKIPEEQRL